MYFIKMKANYFSFFIPILVPTLFLPPMPFTFPHQNHSHPHLRRVRHIALKIVQGILYYIQAERGIHSKRIVPKNPIQALMINPSPTASVPAVYPSHTTVTGSTINQNTGSEIVVHPKDLKSKTANHRLLPQLQSEMRPYLPDSQKESVSLRAVSSHFKILFRAGIKSMHHHH